MKNFPGFTLKLLQIILTLLVLTWIIPDVTSLASSVQVSPETIEILARPGDSVPNFIKYTNLSNESVEVTIGVSDLTPSGEDSGVTVTNSPKYALTPYLTLQSRKLTVPPDSSRSVEFVISIPGEEKPRGLVGGVTFSTPGQPELATLILLSIAGYTYQPPTLLSFTANNTFTPGSASFTALVSNPNRSFLKTAGQIKIYDLLNREVAVLDIPPHNILPESVRKINMTWEKRGLTGVYRAELTSVNDKTRDKLVSQAYIVGTSTLGVYLLLAVFIATAVLIYRKRRS